MNSLSYWATLDTEIFRAINDYCGWSPSLDRLVVHVETLKGALFLGLFGYLWYKPDKEQARRRETLIVIVFAVAIALVANRVLSMLLPFRERPMYGIGAFAPTFEWHADLEHWSSFPSDNATYLFAIAAGLWRIGRPWGLLFGIFATCAALARVYLGIHYPSDVLVGALLGMAVSFVFIREPVLRRIGRPLLAYKSWRPEYFYAVLFLAIAEVGTGFPNTRRIGVAIVHLFVGYNTTT